MPTILETFHDYDSDMLETIADKWGIKDDIDPSKKIKHQLSSLLCNKTLFKEIIEALPPDAQTGLQQILRDDGKTPAAQFMRMFGKIREMGAAAREKERPDINPISTAEILYYKGLIALSFFQEKDEAEEYVYLPDEFINLLKPLSGTGQDTLKPPACPVKAIKQVIAANDTILDHTCALLAALRGKVPADEAALVIPPRIYNFLNAFFISQGLTDKEGTVSNLGKLKHLLLDERDTAFSNLCISWMEDKTLNELKLLPGLVFDGKWINEPNRTRENIINIIAKLPGDTWYRISEVVNWIHKTQPDFQRTSGEYDLWFIKDTAADTIINGFENWDQVEGKLLEYYLTGPLFWMGCVDLALEGESKQPTVFKKSKWSQDLLEKCTIKYSSTETSECVLHSNGQILVPANIQREIRYQIARFCIWEKQHPNYFLYKLSSTAIKRAEAQNITRTQIKALFEKVGKKPIPKNLFIAIDKWDKHQSQIAVEKQTLIQVESADIMDQIAASPAKKYIVERLNPTTAIVSSNQLHHLENALVKLGFFPDIWREV